VLFEVFFSRKISLSSNRMFDIDHLLERAFV
jgi:hypothetical protein